MAQAKSNKAAEAVDGAVETVDVSKHPTASIERSDLSLADIERRESHPGRWVLFIVLVLAAMAAGMGVVSGAEYRRDEDGVWHGEETEAVLKPAAVADRLARLSGEWATVGTGWQAWPDLAKESGLTLSSGEVELPAAEDMLPLAIQLLAAGKTVAVEHAEPVYLRNEVAWKKLPGRE